MTALVLAQFLGSAPRIGARLLPENMGTVALNARAATGYLAGRPQDFKFDDLPASPGGKGFVYRIVDEADGSNHYLIFTTPYVDVVRAPLVGDQFERYYWAASNLAGVWYNTLDRIKDGHPPFKLGLQRPPGPPNCLILDVGVSTIVEDRRYVITYVDEYGHESQPSDPRRISVKGDEAVEVSWLHPNDPDNRPIDPDEKPIHLIRIYRTVPGTNTAAFFFVGEMPTSLPDAETTFLDNLPTDEVALNEIMKSTLWAPPPANLKGLALMANGFLAGYAGKNLWFSEPYRPHAWPPAYGLAVEEPIVGLGSFGSTLVVLTSGVPYIVAGTAPESLSMIKAGPTNACLSRSSIVSLTDSVVYAGEDGLVRIDGAGNQTLVTRDIITREQWQRRFFPKDILAAVDGASTYAAYKTTVEGFEIDLDEPGRGIVELRSAGNIQAFNSDDEGRRPLIAYNDDIHFYAESGMAPAQYTWISKEFFYTQPLNMGACQIDALAPEPDDYDTVLEITKPLPPGFTLALRLVIVADGKSFYDEVQDLDTLGQPFKLPSDMMAQVWQVRLIGNVPVARVVLAETETELAQY